MRRNLRFLTILPLVMSIVSSAADAQNVRVQLPTQQQLSRVRLERVWWAQAVINPQRDKIAHISIDEEVVYVQTTSGIVTAFDTETGRQKWAQRLAKFDQPGFAPISNEEEALVIFGSTMYGLDKNSGQLLWQLVIDSPISTGPSVDSEQVYFGTLDGSLYAYNLKKIRKLYAQRRLPGGAWEAQSWKFKAAKEITSPPIVSGRSIIFASRDGSLYSVTPKDRKLHYQLETDRSIVTPLARLDNTIYIASEDDSFLAVNMFNGQIEWEFTSGLPIRTSMWAINRSLYVFPERSGLISFDPKTGRRLWANPNLKDFVAMLDGAIATLDYNGNLVVVTQDKGEVVGVLPVRQFARPVGNDRTDRIFLATDSGLVVCLRQIGHSYPVYYRFPDRLPLLPEFEEEEQPANEMKDDATPADESPAEEMSEEKEMSEDKPADEGKPADDDKPEMTDEPSTEEPKADEPAADTEEMKDDKEKPEAEEETKEKEEEKKDDKDKPKRSDSSDADPGFGDANSPEEKEGK